MAACEASLGSVSGVGALGRLAGLRGHPGPTAGAQRARSRTRGVACRPHPCDACVAL